MKIRIATVILILIFLFGICGVYAQSIEQQLNYYDQQIYFQFTTFYPADNRYNYYLNEIATNLNSKIVDVFGEDKNIVFYVCPSPLGFNAVSFYRVIIFDSLLLDSLRFLAMGKVYYGGLDNQYIDRLAYSVAKLSRAHQQYHFNINFNDQNNPFGLPTVGPLSQQQQAAAQNLFKSMLASWMSHEGSHCMLDHMKVRLEKMRQAQQKLYYQGDRNQFMSSMNNYVSAQISQELEKEADISATKWLIEAGYSIEGYITWLKFGQKLEKIMGTENAYIRTHPKCTDRIEYIRETARELQ